jgi:high affinity Mn2+ porin
MKMMRRICYTALITMFVITLLPGPVLADSVRDELKALKARIDQLEQKLTEQDTKIEKQETVISEHDTSFKELEGIKDVFSGLEIGIGATSVVQGTIGNDDNVGKDSTDASYSVDLEITSKIGENGTALLYLEGGEGDGVTDELEGFNGYNADATGDDADLQISEIWYEHNFKNNMIVATFGKMDITRWFDGNEVANDETSQFLADVFVNNIAVEFPDYAYGSRVTISPNDLFDISLAALDADSDFEDIFDENFLIAEIGVKPVINEMQGNYRIYGWHNSSDKTEIDDPTEMRENGYGFGMSMDQAITDALSAFARIGWQDDNVYAVEYAWSLGFQVAGSLWGRDDDVIGLGYARSETGEDYRDSLRIGGMRTTAAEETIEAYYNFKVNDNISLSPDIQYANDMAGDEGSDSVWILGVRAQLDF